MEGTIFDIQRFSIHDGPGIRTTVFLKGCTLHCYWCHNPESIGVKLELEFYPQKCIGCGACVVECPQGANTIEDGILVYNRAVCEACGRCVEACFAGARLLSGRKATVDEVMAEVMADRSFYEDSGGGVTLSGGEPVLQHEFARAILECCKAEGIHTAIETAGNYPWEHAEKLLPFVDLVMMDIKHMDPDAHRRATGVTNKRVLENARRFALSGKPVIFRTPVIPTVNDTADEIAAIAAFVRQLTEDALRATGKNGGGPEAHISYELLAFHKLAADKYRSLDMDYNAVDHDPPTSEHMEALREAARGQGVAVR